MDTLGRRLCDRLDCKLTGYGVVSSEGGQIFATVVEKSDEEEMVQKQGENGIGGMQM